MNTTTNDKELRELDAWIAEHVMGWVPHCRNSACYVLKAEQHTVMTGTSCKAFVDEFLPTVRPAKAMEVLKKCADKCASVEVYKGNHFFEVRHDGMAASSETLELAICRFAQKLFGG